MSSANPSLSSLSLSFVEGLYEDFLRDPASIDPDWRAYFESLPPNGHVQRARPVTLEASEAFVGRAPLQRVLDATCKEPSASASGAS